MIGEDVGSRSRSTFAAIDGHKVRAGPGFDHHVGQVMPDSFLSYSRLDAHGQAGSLRNGLYKLTKSLNAGEGRVARRRMTIFANRNSPKLGDLWRDLLAWQQSAKPGLSALAQLDLDRSHRCRLHQINQAFDIELALRGAASEIRRTELEHQIATVQVMRRQPSFTSGLPTP